jgi:chitodextrinase
MLFRRNAALTACLLSILLIAQPAAAVPGSVQFFVNGSGSQNQDYADQTVLPPGFGDGEFTFEVWIRPNDSFPVGPTDGGADQLQNWSSTDIRPYSTGNWWFKGNFLLDGHNNGSDFSDGTFSLQFYGGGRVRWLFGDGSSWRLDGSLYSVGAFPASNTPSLLDGAWHQLTLVRRWSGQSAAQLELWIDGSLIATETSSVRTNMRQYWNTWPGFPQNQAGWFWGAEKRAVVGLNSQYEDYKGLVDEIRFWSRAKSAAEIAANYADPVSGSEPGLVGHYTFGEAQGDRACDAFAGSRCIFLRRTYPGVWSADNAPLSNSGDTTAPTAPGNLQATAASPARVDLTWSASTDDTGVVAYDVRRNGNVVSSGSNLTFSDTGLAASTTYTYTVSARDAAGNVSPPSNQATATTPSSNDTQPPSVPSGLQGSATSNTAINLSWNASTDNVAVTGYAVRRDGTLIATPTGTTFNDTGLVAATTYSYTVAARDGAGNESAESAAVSVTTTSTTDTQPPSTPGNLQGTGVSPSRIDLNWSAATDNVAVTAYVVRRDGATAAQVSQTSYSDTGLSSNTSYVYTVSARDAAGNESAESGGISVATLPSLDIDPPSVPSGLGTSTVTASTIGLVWNPATDNVGIEAYIIRRNNVQIAESATTRFTDTGLAANTSYSYTISARDFAGNQSAASASLNVRTAGETSAPDGGGGGGGVSIPFLVTLCLVCLFICRKRRVETSLKVVCQHRSIR